MFFTYVASIVIDILWMILMLPAWNSESVGNKKWDDLGTVHGFVSVSSFIELGIKGIFLLFIVKRPDNEGKAIPGFVFYNNLIAK